MKSLFKLLLSSVVFSSFVFAGVLPVPRTKSDFDGEGIADLAVFRPSTGIWYMQRSILGFKAVPFGIASDKMVSADYDADFKTDVAVYRNGMWYIQRSRDGFIGIQFGSPDDIPQPADYSGDQKAEVAVFRPSTGVWYMYNLATNQSSAFQFGQAGDIPVANDYDGDLKEDVAVYRNGTWYLQRSKAGFTAVQFGQAGDKPVPGDYDADRSVDVAVFRPSSGAWYWNGSSEGIGAVQFGLSTDKLVPTDYDGDMRIDPAVYRNGIWYIRRTMLGSISYAFGDANDIPIVYPSEP